MSDEDREEVVTGEEAASEVENTEVVASTETPPPGESEEVLKLRKEVSGLKSAASSERHKRHTIEQEYEKLNSTQANTDFDPFNPDAVKQVVASTLAEERQKAQQAEANKQWDDRIEQAQQDHADVNIAEIIQDETFYPYVSDAMAEVIRNDPDGVSVMLHLNNNRNQLHELAQLNPIQAAQQMGRIAEQIKASGTVKTSNAPDPITPVGSRSVSTKNPDDMSPREYEAYMREKRGGTVFL